MQSDQVQNETGKDPASGLCNVKVVPCQEPWHGVGALPAFLHYQSLSALRFPFVQNDTMHPEEEGLSSPQKIPCLAKLPPAFIPLCSWRKSGAATPPF